MKTRFDDGRLFSNQTEISIEMFSQAEFPSVTTQSNI